MDIKKEKRPAPFKTFYWLFGVSAVLLGIYWAINALKAGEYSVDINELRFATVMQGPLKISVRAPGRLLSTDIRWLTSSVNGTVEQVLVKPGSMVEAGDLVAVLSNPELLQQLDELTWDLEALRALTEAEIKQLESSLLDQKAAIAKTKADFLSVKMEYDAQDELRKKNLSSVSKIAFESMRLQKEQQESRWHIETERMANIKEAVRAQISAKKANVNKLEHQITQAKKHVADLQIKANLTGMVQEVQIELGQQLNIGTNVAKLAKQNELIAQLSVPELQIGEVKIGQVVAIDTRDHLLKGEVSRVSPSVIAGSVEVDVSFQESLPANLRPDFSIEGEITVSDIANAIFVKRPAYSQSFRAQPIFKVSADRRRAERVMVDFGRGSTQDIEIVEGLNPGDTIVLSAPNDLENYQSVKINQ